MNVFAAVLNFGRFWWCVRYGVRDPCNTVRYLLAWQLVTVHASVDSRTYDSIGNSNLRYLPGNDSELERRVIGMTVVRSHPYDSCWWLAMMLVALPRR